MDFLLLVFPNEESWGSNEAISLLPFLNFKLPDNAIRIYKGQCFISKDRNT